MKDKKKIAPPIPAEYLEPEKMYKLLITNSLGKAVYIEVNQDVFDILKAEVIKQHVNTVSKMTLYSQLNLDLLKVMNAVLTEEMVNAAIQQVVNNLKQKNNGKEKE